MLLLILQFIRLIHSSYLAPLIDSDCVCFVDMLNVCCTVAHHKYVGLLVHVFKLCLVTQLELCKESNGVCVFQSINVFISDNRDQSVLKCKFECIYVSERANLFVTDRARLHI